jgi:acyl-CoA thioesterase
MHNFIAETAVTPDPEQPRRYGGVLSTDWNAPFLPQGGIVAATALRAMMNMLDNADQPLRSATAVFAGQVQPGSVDIDVDVLRCGRSISQLRATLRSTGQDSGTDVTAVFGRARPGFSFAELTQPQVPPPQDCPSFRDVTDAPDIPLSALWARIHGRRARGHAPWEVYEPGSSEQAFWYRFDEQPLLDNCRLDPLSLLVLCDTMPGAVAERAGPKAPPWLAPSADLTVHLLGSASSEWLLAVIRLRHANDGYASVEAELWDPAHGLVAYATQVIFFSFLEAMPGAAEAPSFGSL